VQCAKALFNKGVTLVQLQKLKEASQTFTDLIQRHQDYENTEIQSACLSALSNNAELLIVLGSGL